MKFDRSEPPACIQSISVRPDGAVLLFCSTGWVHCSNILGGVIREGICMRSECLCFILLVKFEWSSAELGFLIKWLFFFFFSFWFAFRFLGTRGLSFALPVLEVMRDNKKLRDLHRWKTSGSETRASCSFMTTSMPFWLSSTFYWKARSLIPPLQYFSTTWLLLWTLLALPFQWETAPKYSKPLLCLEGRRGTLQGARCTHMTSKPSNFWGNVLNTGLKPVLEMWYCNDVCGSLPHSWLKPCTRALPRLTPARTEATETLQAQPNLHQHSMHTQWFVKFLHMTPPSPSSPPHFSSQRSWTLKGPGEKRNKTLNNLFWRNSQWRGTNNVSLKEAGPLTLPFSLRYLKA